jgi:hypothetical protein
MRKLFILPIFFILAGCFQTEVRPLEPLKRASALADDPATLAKDKSLDRIWEVQKSKFAESFQKPYVNMYKIYFAQRDLSSFLQDSIERNKTSRVKDIAQLYLTFINSENLRSAPTLEIKPISNCPNNCIYKSSIKNEKGEIENLRYWPVDKIDGINKENLISSSQFVYPITAILHYSAIQNLEENQEYGTFFREFRLKYYPVVYRHHILRWVLNRGFDVGNFPKMFNGVWTPFNHFDLVNNLIDKKFTKNTYDNMIQDLDGWIAFSMGHLLAAHDLRPDLFPMTEGDAVKLGIHLENFITLLHSRMNYEILSVPNGSTKEKVEVVTIDKGGMLGWKDLAYAGYSGTKFPGAQYDDEKVTVIAPAMTPPPPIPVAWDLSHARRFVNFFWSMKNLESFRLKNLSYIYDAEVSSADHHTGLLSEQYSKVFGICSLVNKSEYLKCRSDTVKNHFNKAAVAYANNLLYRVTIRKTFTDADFTLDQIHFSNYLCGTNGWYRVDYLNTPYAGYPPSSKTLEVSLIEGGQSYFIQFNQKLELPLKALYVRAMSKNQILVGSADELRTFSGFPASFFSEK